MEALLIGLVIALVYYIIRKDLNTSRHYHGTFDVEKVVKYNNERAEIIKEWVDLPSPRL